MHPGQASETLARAALTEVLLCPALSKAWAGMTQYRQHDLLWSLQAAIAGVIGDWEECRPPLHVVSNEPTALHPLGPVQNQHEDDDGGDVA